MEWLTSLYPAVRQHLFDSIPDYWPELVLVFEPYNSDPVVPEIVLPLASCEAVGGNARDAVPVAASLAAKVVGLRLLDDLQDQDRPGQLWQSVGPARTWNYAAAAQNLTTMILYNSSLPPEVAYRISQLFHQTYLQVGAGQDRHLAGTADSPTAYWESVELRSGQAYAAACTAGAMVAGDNLDLIQACSTFGFHLGCMMQIFNDLESIWKPRGVSDHEQARLTLPVLVALQSDHPDKEELLVLLGSSGGKLERIKEILEAAGARDYMIWLVLQERDKALAALKHLPGSQGVEALEALVTGICGDIDSFA